MAGLAAFLAALAGVIAVLVGSDQPYLARPPAGEPTRTDTAGAARVLADLERAVRRGDGAAAAALAPDGQERTADLLAAAATNARALRLRDLALRYVDAAEPTADGGWSANVAVTWRLAGFDAAASTTEVRVGLRGEGRQVRISGLGGGGQRTPLWLSGPLSVRRTAQTLVAAAGGAQDARRFERLALDAIPVVTRVLPRWRPRLVLEVPASAAGVDRVLGTEAGTYAAIAAVATTVDGSTSPDAPVHVVANPDEFATLDGTGAQVVMSHEVAHVATGAATSQVPLWLLEGFADYVALRDVALPVSRTAAQAIARLREEGVPAALPDARDFDVGGAHLGAVYESAWVACTVLAERGGEPALVELQRRLHRGDALEPALRGLFGWTAQDLLGAWQARLRELAE